MITKPKSNHITVRGFMGGQEIIHSESSGKNAENIPDDLHLANQGQKEESEEQIINNNKRIADFRQKVAAVQNESLGRYKKIIGELEKRNIEISKRIDSLNL